MKHSPEPHNWAPKKPKYLKKAQHSHAQEHAENDPKRKEIEAYLDEHCVVFWKGKITPASKMPPFDSICHWGFGDQHNESKDDVTLGIVARMIKEYCTPYNTQDVMYEQAHTGFLSPFFHKDAGDRFWPVASNGQRFMNEAQFPKDPINWDDTDTMNNWGKYKYEACKNRAIENPTAKNIKNILFLGIFLRNEGMDAVTKIYDSIDQWFSFGGRMHYLADPIRFGKNNENTVYVLTKEQYNLKNSLFKNIRKAALDMTLNDPDFTEYKAWRKEYIREMGDPFAN